MNRLKTSFALLFTTLLLPAAPASADTAREIIDATGIQGGIILHLGSGDGELTANLKVNDRYQVQGLDRDPENVARAREHIHGRKLYGDVSVDQLTGDNLPYVDNLLNLVVAEDFSGITEDEIMRVLAPHGVAYLNTGEGWDKVVKPRPDTIGEWTHFMHDASGNAVSHDDVVGPPRHLQWLGSPRWSRHHDRISSINALVSAGGRMFYVMDEGSRTSILLPSKWTLVARDAFNGTILWKKPLEGWHHHLWPLKSGSTQVSRRLVAIGDRVYATLGKGTSVSAINAATGEIVETYGGTDKTEELIFSEGKLFVLTNPGEWELDDFAPLKNTGDQARVRTEYAWNEKPRQLVAIDAASGRKLWERETKVAPLTLSADSQGVFIHDGEKIVSLHRDSGEIIWSSQPVQRKSVFTMNFGPKLVLYDGIVLYAGGDRTMKALDGATGEEMWEAPHEQSGYQSPEDLLVAGGLVWAAPLTSGKMSGVFTGRDPKTGDVKKQFPPDVETYWFHHRCYISKATDNFLMPSRTGIEFVDPDKETWDINHWVRGSCLYGVMPANGMVYAPPHNCACYPEAKLYGINALAPSAPSRGFDESLVDKDRRRKGPAFNRIKNQKSAISNQTDWPTYRGDNLRSGHTAQSLPVSLGKSWEVDLGTKVTPPVIAGNRVYVATPDTHTVHALDASNGEPVWNFTTGGRVDSPPTVVGNAVYFGSADGWVYCARADDGVLAWRFRAAPTERRLTAFEQLESVWPVHGSVLVEGGIVTAVAGRSNFLDGGLRFCRLDAATGELLGETLIDEKNPETGNNLQEKIATLQMPAGLPDILSSDGEHVYMRSQRFDLKGEREEIGPVSGDFAGHGGYHSGEGRHLFAPMGFLDDTWFHRSYWVYGKNFAGGHGGYYQAGKFAPSGRLLVHDDENVYGFARKPEYLKWTTTIEHQLFAASKAPPVTNDKAARRGNALSMITFEKSDSLDPTRQGVAVEAWIKAEENSGVILSRGGPTVGFALVLKDDTPEFVVRPDKDTLVKLTATRKIRGGKWVHVAAALSTDQKMQVFIDGVMVGEKEAPSLITKEPIQIMSIGAEDKMNPGGFKPPFGFTGVIDSVKLHHGNFEAKEIAEFFASRGAQPLAECKTVLDLDFEQGKVADASGFENHGALSGAVVTKGQKGDGLRFAGKANRQGGSQVEHYWDKDLPLLVMSMVLADDTLFVAGPPDIIDEESAFLKLTEKDPAIEKLLAKQDAALLGEQGGLLWVVDAKSGEKKGSLELDALPAWNGLAAGNGSLFMATRDGRLVCLSGE